MTLNTTALTPPEMYSDTLAHSIPDAVPVRSLDAWSQILATLVEYSSASIDLTKTPDISAGARTQRSRRPVARSDGAPSSTITVIEKLSDTLVSLSWHDSTLCNYEEQVWACGHARSSGRCALSGKPIRGGDAIYRPRSRGRAVPSNGAEMILASELARLQCANSRQQLQTGNVGPTERACP